MKRRIVYISGTRADFGLLQRTLYKAAADPRLDLQVCVTGMHLLKQFGNTLQEIEASGLPIVARIPVDLGGGDGASMACALGQGLIGMTEVLSRERPDLVLILGDRGEMLAGALAALHLNIPIAHLHGGERSGTVDEPVRHAISKLAHYHMVSTAGAQERLIRMGENAENIFVTGAPGLDELDQLITFSRGELCLLHELNPSRPVALVLFHPVVQQVDVAAAQISALLAAVRGENLQALCLMPNSDAGNVKIQRVLKESSEHPDIRLATHLARPLFVSWLAAADLLVGNSSSGIIEAASLGLPVVNIGSRQNSRERSDNVVDAVPEKEAIRSAIGKALNLRGRDFKNIYGDGKSGRRIVELLATLPLNVELLNKTNTY